MNNVDTAKSAIRDMADDSSMKWYHKIIKESFSFAIALVLLIPFMIYFGVVLIYLQDTVLLEKMTALLGGLVAIVIGYYFGQRPLKELSNQVKTVQQEKDEEKKEKETTKSQYKESKGLISDILDDYEKQKREIEELRDGIRRLENE